MKVFICSYNNYYLAVPMDLVSSIMLYKKNTDKINFTEENDNIYISLPLLFNCPSLNIHHGIILKNDNIENSNKIILLTTEIENETEIQNDIIFPIQKSLENIIVNINILNNIRFSEIFNGLFFKAGHLVLLLNPLPIINYSKRS